MVEANTETKEKEVEEISEEAVKNDITPNKDGGVLKEVVVEGDGEYPNAGDTVSVHYVGTLAEDGSQFDSSRDRGDKFEFILGKGEVIKAWDIGVATMKKGEVCRLTCRSDYAYGKSGSPPKIPADATLVFEVELFSWNTEDLSFDKDGGITRTQVVAGEGYISPKEGAIVDIHIKGSVNGTVFDERDVKFTLGEGSDQNIPEGLEKAIEKFKKNETSIINLTPKYIFGSAGKPDIGIPPAANVSYEVTLKDFEQVKESWEMQQDEKIQQAKLNKEKGTKYFKKENYQLAVKQYIKVTDLMSYDTGFEGEAKIDNHALLKAGQLNLAACYLKLNDYSHALEFASKVLDGDPNNVKALYRKAQACESLGESESAIVALNLCISLEPTNSAAKKQLAACKQSIKKNNQKAKEMYSGMFQKFAKEDSARVAQDSSEKPNKGKRGDLSELKLLSASEEIKGEEYIGSATK